MTGGASGTAFRQLKRSDGSENINARGHALLYVLANVLERLVTANNQLVDGNTIISKFHAQRPPSISIYDYIKRVFKYASCSPECLVLALVYIDRLIHKHNFTLNSYNVHRILITSIMLSAKYFDDQYFNNAFYARVGGVPCEEMNSLEIDFLFLINFSLHVTPQSFLDYYNQLTKHPIFIHTLYSELSITLPVSYRQHYVFPDLEANNQLAYYTRTYYEPEICPRDEEQN